jgi:nicotinamide riboside kinase
MKKIVLCGTISSGKTTTLNCLRAIFDNLNTMDRTIADPGPLVHFVGEAARTVFETFPALARDSHTTDLRIAHKIMANEMAILADTRSQTLVCDRSIADVFAFARTHDGGHYPDLIANKLLSEYVKTYDRFLIFSPVGVPYVEEDIRIEGISFREKLHQTFLDLFAELGVRYEVIDGALSQRVSRVLNAVLEEHYGGN